VSAYPYVCAHCGEPVTAVGEDRTGSTRCPDTPGGRGHHKPVR
jgi:DNA-directed RNA polymerase subunit RPC12/RpoP